MTKAHFPFAGDSPILHLYEYALQIGHVFDLFNVLSAESSLKRILQPVNAGRLKIKDLTRSYLINTLKPFRACELCKLA